MDEVLIDPDVDFHLVRLKLREERNAEERKLF